MSGVSVTRAAMASFETAPVRVAASSRPMTPYSAWRSAMSTLSATMTAMLRDCSRNSASADRCHWRSEW